MKFRRKAKKEQEMDISPLIDVVFILLIFFMVTTTFVQDAAVDIEGPGSSSGSKASTKALRVYLDKDGGLFVDDAPVKPWMLQSRVRDFLRDADEGSVLVVADRRSTTEQLVDVVDQCRLAGAVDVGIITDSEG